jgi:hypothetical protein
MKCEKCGHEMKNPTAQAGGRSGGKAKVPKGFSSAKVQKKALETRRANRLAGKSATR